MPPLFDFLFFAAASLLGNVIRGLTGFGSAIVLLCLWGLLVAATGLEVAGGIKRIIRVEAVLHATGAVVLLATVPLRGGRVWPALLITLLPTIFCGVPLGAQLLLLLPPRPLELAVGLILLLFCGQRVAPDVLAWLRRWRGVEDDAGGAEQRPGAKYVQLTAAGGGGGADDEIDEGEGEADLAAPSDPHDAADDDPRQHAPTVSAPLQALAGAAGGLLSGVLTGSLAVGGPPTIIMYQLLGCSKGGVRAMSTLTTAVSAAVRIPTYLLTGQLATEDWPIYLTVAAAGQVGLWLGIYLEPRVDARTFTRLLTGLLAACAAILLVRAAGF